MGARARSIARVAGGIFVVVAGAACSPFGGGAFTCTDDPSCGVGGHCEANSLCSFNDASCASGRRYGEGSGPLAGTCVGDEPADARLADAPVPVIDAPPGTPDGPLGTPDGPLPGLCPAGYAPLGGSATQYRVAVVAAAWQTASGDCNNDDDAGGFTGNTHLVVLSNDAERVLLQAQLASGNKWIGLTDLVVDSQYRWVTAENTAGYPPMDFPPASPGDPPWTAGQPVAGDGEHCARLKNAFDLEDKPCSDSNQYVCECDAFAPL